MDKITIEYDLHQRIDVDIEIGEVIDAINSLPLKGRWNVCAKIINEIRTEIDDLSGNEREVIVNWLKNKLEIFGK